MLSITTVPIAKWYNNTSMLANTSMLWKICITNAGITSPLLRICYINWLLSLTVLYVLQWYRARSAWSRYYLHIYWYLCTSYRLYTHRTLWSSPLQTLLSVITHPIVCTTLILYKKCLEFIYITYIDNRVPHIDYKRSLFLRTNKRPNAVIL